MKVLIVECARQVREGLGAFLKGQGHCVIECASGRDALLRADSYDVDLLISGDRLPDMASAQMVDQLRRSSSHASLPVLVLKRLERKSAPTSTKKPARARLSMPQPRVSPSAAHHKNLESCTKLQGGPGIMAQRSPFQRKLTFLDSFALNCPIRWMEQLPTHVRPAELSRRFPRVLRTIAGKWGDVSECRRYLSSLQLNDPRKRQGIPPKIVEEICALYEYLDAVHPRATRFCPGRSI